MAYRILPLCLQRALGWRAASAAIPVTVIAQIAFDTVQIGMHPRRGRVLLCLRDLAGLAPVSLRLPPQGFERRRPRLPTVVSPVVV